MRDESPGPVLRSGLYLVRSNNENNITQQVFVIYWPEDHTWDDKSIDSVRRNRVTFMRYSSLTCFGSLLNKTRYLTKITHQIVCLISPEQAAAIQWKEAFGESAPMEVDFEESDRLFTFEVSKTNEQEENVTLRQGFVASTSAFYLSY